MTRYLWLFLAACAASPTTTPPPGTDPRPGTDPPPDEHVEATLSGLEPGWLVTTGHTNDGGTAEATIVSDGSPITLGGSSHDVFFATVTDGDGQLVSTQAMFASCSTTPLHTLAVPGQYATIQDAVDAAGPGDMVKVAPGTYSESVRMKAHVCLFGSGAQVTTLDAHGLARNLIDLTDAPGSVISGFTLRGTSGIAGCADSDVFGCSGDWYRAAIYLGGQTWDDPVRYAPPLIINNVFEDNEIGVMLYWHGVSIIRNNVFAANRSAFVANHFQDKAFIANNVFINNSQLAIGNQAAYLDIIDNVIAGSQVGIRFEYVQTGKIRCNVFYDNAANQADAYTDPPRFTIGTDGNVEIDPQFVSASDYHLAPSSPALDAGCDAGHAFEPDGSPIDIGVYGGPLGHWVTF